MKGNRNDGVGNNRSFLRVHVVKGVQYQQPKGSGQVNSAVKLEILNHPPECTVIDSGSASLMKMPGGPNAVFAEVILPLESGKDGAAPGTQRGLGRLKIHYTGRTQEAAHGMPEG